MGSEHTFYDYIDEAGTNAIQEWLNSIPKEVKVKINKRLLHLEGTRQWGGGPGRLVDTLTEGACDDLFEIRASRQSLQYRILGYRGPIRYEATLLWPFIKKGAAVPQRDCIRAQTRKVEVESDPPHHRKRRVEHSYE